VVDRSHELGCHGSDLRSVVGHPSTLAHVDVARIGENAESARKRRATLT